MVLDLFNAFKSIVLSAAVAVPVAAVAVAAAAAAVAAVVAVAAVRPLKRLRLLPPLLPSTAYGIPTSANISADCVDDSCVDARKHQCDGYRS